MKNGMFALLVTAWGNGLFAAGPVIEIDHLPQLGAMGNAEGRVVWNGLTAANAGQYAVIAMLNVDDGYVKPTYERYLTDISADPLGTFTMSVTSHPDDTGVDPLAFYLVERAAFAGVTGDTVKFYNMTADRYLARLLINRSDFWALQLTAPAPNVRPAFLPAGTAVTLSAAADADIWYTTDGSSPTNGAGRQPYTASTALTVPAQGSLLIKTAAARGSAWSETASYAYFPREDLSGSLFFGLNMALNIGTEPFDAVLPRATVRGRLQPFAPLCRWIRTFGTTGAGLEHAHAEAQETFHLKTMVGVYITSDSVNNRDQLDGLAAILDAGPAPAIVMVGNECLLSGVPVTTITSCIDEARAILAVRGMAAVPVGTVDIYGITIDREILDRIDVLGLNFYPGVWNNSPLTDALAELKASYAAALAAFPNKLVLLTETGMPYAGGPYTPDGCTDVKTPTPAIAAAFLDGFLAWTREAHIPAFYFQAYCQPAKNTHPIEPYFGLMNAPGAVFDFYQPVVDKWLPLRAAIAMEAERPVITWTPHLTPGYSYTLETKASLAQTDWDGVAPAHTNSLSSEARFFRVRRVP